MDRFDRIYDLHKLLSSARHPVSREKIEQELECSRATAKRIIESMRLYLDAPICYDRSRNGYYYARKQDDLYELPGLWFNASELHALLSVQQLLSDIEPGLFDKQLQPLKNRIDHLLAIQKQDHADQLTRRVRILKMASRNQGRFFQQVSSATVQRKRLDIDYYNRSRDDLENRQISPQTLVHYRDNWYLDAWCHKREALRTFALDAITAARILKHPALEISQDTLNDHYATAYGIFSGKAGQTAQLLFSNRISRWISRETWHPQQRGELLQDGQYRLSLPYSNPTELIMDILRYADDVVVEAPESLQTAVRKRLERALAQY